jgi:glycosyltransferase involved in cell wall biosynthesis
MSEAAFLSIVHPWDPWSQAQGGFDTALDGILRAVPRGWPIELVGVTGDPRLRPVGQWAERTFADRTVRFFPVLADTEPNRVKRIPLSLAFVLHCRRLGVRVSGRVVEFHRFESGLGVKVKSPQYVVHYLHNHPVEEVRETDNDLRWRRMRGTHDRLLRSQLKRAALVVCVDPRTPEWLERILPGLRGKIVPLSTWAEASCFHVVSRQQQEAHRLALRARLKIPSDSRIVLFVGRLVSQKDPLFLVRAFGGLASRHPDTVLLMVGEGRLAPAIQRAADSLGLGSRVRQVGFRERADLAGIYSGCDVFACTSAFEGGPRTAFESLACGTPVVSFNLGQIGGVLALNPDVGELVKERTESAFAAALSRTLTRTSEASLSKACALAVAGRTPDRCLAPLFERYQEWARAAGQATPGKPP